MADYLESTDGKWALSKMSDHDIERAKDLKAHSNHAERPFAVMKALKHLCPSVRLCHLSALSLARVNAGCTAPKTPAESTPRPRGG